MLTDDEIWNLAIIVVNYCYLVIVVIGTITNIVAFIIFSRKRFENTIFSTYFRFLLVVDTIGLVYLALGKFLYFQFKIQLRDFNESLCRITLLLAYSVPPVSAYTLVAISIDRFLTIAKPTFLIIRKRFSFQIYVCIGIVVANFIYNGQLFFSYLAIDDYYPNSTKQICVIPYQETLQMMDLINSTIIPFLLMIISTILTIKSVFDSRKKISNQSNPNNPGRFRDIKFSITSIAFNIIFLILNFPFVISTQIDTIMTDIESEFLVAFILLLTYLNHGTVFFINYSVNTMFIEEFKIFFNIR
jgi:hypothetical protein